MLQGKGGQRVCTRAQEGPSPPVLLRRRVSTRDTGPAMSAAARGRETPDARAFLGKEEGVNPSPAHSTRPAAPSRAQMAPERLASLAVGRAVLQGRGGWSRHLLPWLQPGTGVGAQ